MAAMIVELLEGNKTVQAGVWRSIKSVVWLMDTGIKTERMMLGDTPGIRLVEVFGEIEASQLERRFTLLKTINNVGQYSHSRARDILV